MSYKGPTNTPRIYLAIPDSVENPNDNFFNFYESIYTLEKSESRVYLGKKYNCRYCGTVDKAKFKRDHSHTFPQLCGNTWLFSSDECKDCNKLFSEYEDELAKHGHIARVLLGAKKKKTGAVKYKDEYMELQMVDGTLQMKIKDSETPFDKSKHAHIERSIDFSGQLPREDNRLRLPQNKFVPLYLLKCLSKIALGVMPESEMQSGNFDKLKTWLLSKDAQLEWNKFYFNYVFTFKPPFGTRDPMLLLFKKRNEFVNHHIPTYSLVFGYESELFQTFLSCEADSWLDNELKIGLPIIDILLARTSQVEKKFKFPMVKAIKGWVTERDHSLAYQIFGGKQ